MNLNFRKLVGDLLASALSGFMHDTLLDEIPGKRVYDSAALQQAQLTMDRLRQSGKQNPDAWVACGSQWYALDDLDNAMVCFNQALAINPGHPLALDGLATACKTLGELDEAITLYRKALEFAPDNRLIFQNLLFAMLCSSAVSDAEIFDWHQRFAQTFEAPLEKNKIRHGRAATGQRLRIGYVSADLRDHVTGRCLAPILARHDRKAFKLFCYFDIRLADAHTSSMKKADDTWRNMGTLDDAQLCKLIVKDRIDILVDLSGHTPGNRLTVFARKPAPVQVSYLDYSATTGFQSIDYRFTPAACEPTNQSQDYYTEQLVRLHHGYWMYDRHPEPDAATPSAASGGKRILFSCLNSFYRVTDEAILIWATILKRLPHAKLALVAVPEGQVRERVLARFAKLGIKEARLVLFGVLRHSDYLKLVRATDVALAPFPYNGAMTMLDCLWHGVPVVCLEGGPTFRSSMAEAIYGQLGMQQFIAQDAAAYARFAIETANDANLRSTLRLELRSRMKKTDLCEATNLTQEIESAYLKFWQAYAETV